MNPLKLMGARPNLHALRVSNTVPSSVQSAQTPLRLGRDGTLSGTYQNFRQTYNPLFEGQTAGRQGQEQVPFWSHQ